jgi:hypothetical protein
MDTEKELALLKAEVAALKASRDLQKMELDQLKKTVEGMKEVVSACVRSSQKNNKQLAVPPQVKELMATVREDVKKEIFAAINEHMVPQFKSQVQWLNYQTEDTQELLTQYQMQQMTGSLKTISGSSGGRLEMGMLD